MSRSQNAPMSARERVRTAVRLALPGPVKRGARLASNAVDPLRIRRYRARTGDRRPLPPGGLRARSGRPDLAFYVESAERSAAELEAALARRGRRLADFERVLDFGCGCARVLAALAERGDGPLLHGCDVDAAAIRWAQGSYPAIRFARSGGRPPLPYDDEYFDLVYASSVFTHLDGESQAAWLAELRRILRPGGLAVVSVYGEHAFSSYRSRSLLGASRDLHERLAAHESLEAAGMIFAPYRRSAWNRFNFAGGDEPYGFTFNSAGQVRREWSRGLEVVDIGERGWWAGTQDLVVLERPSPAAASLDAVAAGAGR